MTTADPLTSLASAVFRSWAIVAKSAMAASEATMRTLAEAAVTETRVVLGNVTLLKLGATAGAVLSGSQFVWIAEETGGPATKGGAEYVIEPENVSFRPPTVPKPVAGATKSEVILCLDPDHEVRTGLYVGNVLADGKEVDTALVLVKGKNP